MLSLRTVTPDTLELLRALMSAPELSSLRLVGGTALALQYGHRVLADINKIINNNFANQVIKPRKATKHNFVQFRD